MRLVHEPRAINLGAVLHGIQPDFALVECFAAEANAFSRNGVAWAGVLGDALQAFTSHLDGLSLADLLPAPACRWKRA